MGHPVGNLTRDEVLDNITFYWLTNTGISSARLYWENTFDFFGVKNVNIPAAVSVFPKEIYRAPRRPGLNAPTPSSSTSTRLTGAATSPPGRSRNSFPSFVPGSGRCADRRRRLARTPAPPPACVRSRWTGYGGHPPATGRLRPPFLPAGRGRAGSRRFQRSWSRLGVGAIRAPAWRGRCG